MTLPNSNKLSYKDQIIEYLKKIVSLGQAGAE